MGTNHPQCHPAITHWLLKWAPEDPRDPEVRIKQVNKMNEKMDVKSNDLFWFFNVFFKKLRVD